MWQTGVWHGSQNPKRTGCVWAVYHSRRRMDELQTRWTFDLVRCSWNIHVVCAWNIHAVHAAAKRLVAEVTLERSRVKLTPGEIHRAWLITSRRLMAAINWLGFIVWLALVLLLVFEFVSPDGAWIGLYTAVYHNAAESTPLYRLTLSSRKKIFEWKVGYGRCRERTS